MARLDQDQVHLALDSSANGLKDLEVERRQARYGPNAIAAVARTPLYRMFLGQFTHTMAILLWLAGAVALISGTASLAVAIWAVNLINGAFAFWQEYKADRATQALMRLLPEHASVRRGGVSRRIDSADLVPGDVVVLGEGDRISADARLIQAAGLHVSQATLTGESLPVPKTADPWLGDAKVAADLPNIVYAGTSVTQGDGVAVVFATGMATETGKLAHLTQATAEPPSPLQIELARVTRVVTLLACAIGGAFFLVASAIAGIRMQEAFLFGIGMVVAFVPEGMLPTVTFSLALAVQRMAQANALVKRLSAIETLGCTTVICTDKTGTLTQNAMLVQNLWVGGRNLCVSGEGFGPKGEIHEDGQTLLGERDPDLRALLVAAALCNNAALEPPARDGKTGWRAVGDPTEASLLVVASKAGLEIGSLTERMPRLAEVPFDPHRKRMSTVNQEGEGRIAFTKGAPHELLAVCSAVLSGGQSEPLTAARRQEILATVDRFASSGQRVLAVASRQLEAPEEPTVDIEREMLLLGLVAMSDPLRPRIPESVARCLAAGIRIVMVTGDYGLTALGIARAAGIVDQGPVRVVTGHDLEAMSDEGLEAILRLPVVFARTPPEDKLKIVRVLQRMGHVVAVTGDGVNDAPALRRADIGVAMGLTGTDVAREAAEMVLADDNFASIVQAVACGRAVFANIRRFATYIFTSNTAEAFPFVAMLLSGGRIPLPLGVMQVLSIDLGADMVPAIGLGAEAPEAGVMHRPPRSSTERLLSAPVLARAMLWYGLIEGTAGLMAYFFRNWEAGWPLVPLAVPGTVVYHGATTMTLAAIISTQAGVAFACRTDREPLRQLPANRLLMAGVAIQFGILASIVYVPFFQRIFGATPLRWQEWAFVLVWIPVVLLSDAVRKTLLKRFGR